MPLAFGQSQAFEAFALAEQDTTGRFGGMGLGLSIARQLGRLMGGEIGVHSPPGEGSCLWFRRRFPGAHQGPHGRYRRFSE
ncbi:MAG: Signal transduction histidine-protein kinase BarA [Candidatus Accumulibacter sp. SK-11]|nr:MAG: Signal transduction histidine-protein kinase BarA [Candidatus Accumulibacter sp. SK-11]HRL78173.1 ATP-binding protein [Candidatus Accumulibacter phosphatis]